MDYYFENTQVFKALSDPKRAMIVDMLSCGELCACEILEKFDISQSTLSHHLKILRDCGLVNGREQGKWMYYSLDPVEIEKTKLFFDVITTNTNNCICTEVESSVDNCAQNK